MKHLLVIRNSAMGDVALAVPAVKAALTSYPDVRITIVSHSEFSPFFEGMERLSFFGADYKGEHKGTYGLFKLTRQLMKLGPFDAVLDLHSVIRSWFITAHFSAMGISVFRIDKGRKDKKAITRLKDKVFKRLKPSYERYADVFAKAGYPLAIDNGPWISHPQFPEEFFNNKLLLPKKGRWIGIAPFSKHLGKNWPASKASQLVQDLAENGHTVFLFGGSQDEHKLDEWALKSANVHSLAEKFPLNSELGVMQKMDLMVTMDSSNLHMASLVGTPVVSIWGSTHSFAGFEPLGKNKHLKVEIDPADLTCRPCSVFGNKPCFRGDYACLQWIEVKDVRAKINGVLEELN
ncbi:MAG TPA: glycosyltransferase family 9 protein [Cyclobacteriaceae bacterium]|nr:glycosyltransferase family 9 protein [Cyclobacteriaceae bacterium]